MATGKEREGGVVWRTVSIVKHKTQRSSDFNLRLLPKIQQILNGVRFVYSQFPVNNSYQQVARASSRRFPQHHTITFHFQWKDASLVDAADDLLLGANPDEVC
nr:hypothetical protein BgiMline_021833 [Biomphalaria glabrata]